MGRIVHVHQAKRNIVVPPGRTLLEAALAEGIAYPHGCRSGRCGSCKSRLIDGSVDLLPHTPFALSDEEREMGFILACRAKPSTDATVAWLGNEDERADHPVRSFVAHVAALVDATHDIKRVRLVPDDGRPFIFDPGQYAQLSFDGAPARDHSMANRPGAAELEFYIRRVPGGITSHYVARKLVVGDRVTVRGPFGSSYLRQWHTGPILAVAGGSGMAPIKSIVEAALAHGFRQPIHLYFGVRQERDLYLAEHFRHLSSIHGNLSFIPVLSQADRSNVCRRGLLSDAIAEDHGDLDGFKVYAAGPPAMTDALIPMLLKRSLQPADLHVDVFFTPEEPAALPEPAKEMETTK